MRVLNVDDREENRYLVEALFMGNGYEVVSVANGAEALVQLQSGPFDLIISDILMPVMDGFQLCRAVKENEAFRHIPFIVYTATYTGPQDETFAMKIGANRFVVKPCEPDVLMDTVHDVLRLARDGDIASQSTPPAPEEEVLKLYSERLVRKLEQKMAQLENEAKARLKVEDILRQSEKKYRSLYNSIRDAIFVFDMSGIVLDCNQAFFNLFGYPLNEIAGKHTAVIYENEEESRKFGMAIRDHVDNSTHLYSAQFRKKNGAVFPGEVNVSFLRNDEGITIGFIGIIRDITERVRAEKDQNDLEFQLHQAQKMESVGRLAGGVAHDYNNMLSVILGYSELALRKLKPADKLYGDLREIHKAAVRSSEITRQLLAFARRQTIAPLALNLNEAVQGILKMLRRLIGEDIDLAWLPGIDPLPVMMDPSQVDQLLANLCVNARDAINGVGRITIETNAATFDAAYCADHAGFIPGDYVILVVSDDGCGMDRETAAQIFEPFFTTKPIGQGTGLGLATVYGIVKQNNGFINVYSEPGKGTTLKIYLVRHTDPALVTPRERPTSIPLGQGEIILVVEDEESILKIARKILEGLGYTVLTADNPSQALRLAREHPIKIDLLITDVVMPEMNGKDLSNRLQEICPGLKTLFMSGYTANVIAHRGVLDEGIQFIQKPFSMESMAIKVKEALERSFH